MPVIILILPWLGVEDAADVAAQPAGISFSSTAIWHEAEVML